jgi:hypothetical protein
MGFSWEFWAQFGKHNVWQSRQITFAISLFLVLVVLPWREVETDLSKGQR